MTLAGRSHNNSTMTRATQYRYNVDGLLKELVCRNGESEQVTRWVYGVEKAGANGIARADLVREKIYPDGGADRVSYAYNQLGQPVEMLDQNGTRHEYAYDALGRLTLDSLPDGPGAGVDGAIRAIGRSYAVDGDLEKVTSYSDAEATTVANEVEYVRNAFGQVTEERQSHGAGVAMAQVEYAYQSAAGGGNSARRTEIVYPASKQVDLRYEGTINDAASRLRKLVDPNTTPTETALVSYNYLGMGTLVQQVQAGGLEMTAIKPTGQENGDAGDPYIGYDRFGRLEDARWIRDTGADRERVEFGFDRVGNKIWRRNREADSELFDESYAYDGLYQVKTLARGKLNQNRTWIGGIPQWQEGWRYDEMGNWLGYETAGVNGVPVLSQERSYNAGNELLFIEESNTTVAHDAAGNMTRMPAVGEWNDEEPLVAQGLVWDAWNRLVKIKDADGAAIAEYAYDGLHRRVWKKTGFPSSVVTRHFYYDDRWQIMEGRLDASTEAERHFVWGVRGIDDLVLRDLLASGGVTQRLWALNDGKNVTAIAIGHTVVERYVYDAFGFTNVYDGDFNPMGGSAFGWETRFCAYRWDPESEIYQVRYRYYHPNLGCWLSRDPIAEVMELHLYAYAGNSPFSRFDWSGLGWIEVDSSISIIDEWQLVWERLRYEMQAGSGYVLIQFKQEQLELKFKAKASVQCKCVETGEIATETGEREFITEVSIAGMPIQIYMGAANLKSVADFLKALAKGLYRGAKDVNAQGIAENIETQKKAAAESAGIGEAWVGKSPCDKLNQTKPQPK
jgi:RHS repeat-associated protein